jgi:hypothetical protein
MGTPATDLESAVFNHFPARAYLRKYYAAVGDENAALLHAIADFARRLPGPDSSVIEVAGGPSLFSLLALASERPLPFELVTFTDIARQNLDEVDWWLNADERSFDYDDALDWLRTERGADPDRLVDNLRASRWELVQRDWLTADDPRFDRRYDIVSSHFFAESATRHEGDFLAMLRKVGRLGRPGALVLLSFMQRSAGYEVGGVEFPAFAVDERSVFDYLETAGVELVDAEIRSTASETPSSESGYEGLMFVGGRLVGE